MTATTELLSPDLLTKLDQLDVLSRKVLTGKMQGERRSKKKGQSVEFADYRAYVAGDDLRFIDWNLYARMEKLFLRLFVEEEDLAVCILLDVSASMDYGEPNKLLFAKRLAAALGYIGLVNYNRVSLYAFNQTITAQLPNLRGRRPVHQMLDFIAGLTAAPGVSGFGGRGTAGEGTGGTSGGAGSLEAVCKQFALVQRGKGVVIVLSDFFDKGDFAKALRYFGNERFDVYAVQVLCPQEIDPEKGGVIGDLRLRDVEDGNMAEVSIGPALLRRYRANLQAYCQHLREQSVRHGVAFMIGDSSVPFEQLVLKYLRERGMLG